MNIENDLYELLIKHFNLRELKELCFKIGVDFDSLAGEERDGKARELISYLKRRDRLESLIVEIKKLRPHVKLPISFSLSQANGEKQNKFSDEWIDTIYHYRKYSDDPRGDAFRLRMARTNQAAVVVVSQLPKTPLSLMNAVEYIATNITQFFGLAAEFLVFVQHYPFNCYGKNEAERFSLVQFDWNGKEFSHPRWRPITKEQVEALVEHPL